MYHTVRDNNDDTLYTSSSDLQRTEDTHRCTLSLRCRCVEQTARKEIVSETVPATTTESNFFSISSNTANVSAGKQFTASFLTRRNERKWCCQIFVPSADEYACIMAVGPRDCCNCWRQALISEEDTGMTDRATELTSLHCVSYK